MAVERTFIILKPDAIQRGVAGDIISRFERKGLSIIASKFVKVSRDHAEKHYAEHKGKPFYEGLVSFICSGPVLCLAFEGAYAVAVSRKLIGGTFGNEAEPGTIRGDFGSSRGMNLIHGSDSPESATREIALWFTPNEVVSYERSITRWSYNDEDKNRK